MVIVTEGSIEISITGVTKVDRQRLFFRTAQETLSRRVD
jgi:hypothetical protein